MRQFWRVFGHFCMNIWFPRDLQMGFRKGYGRSAAVFLLKESIAHFNCRMLFKVHSLTIKKRSILCGNI
jgi:hypothetical protein